MIKPMTSSRKDVKERENQYLERETVLRKLRFLQVLKKKKIVASYLKISSKKGEKNCIVEPIVDSGSTEKFESAMKANTSFA